MKLKKCSDCEHGYEVYGCEQRCELDDKDKDCPYEVEHEDIPICPMCGIKVGIKP